MKQPVIYIMTSQSHGTLYTGVSSNLIRRVYEHKSSTFNGFSSKYHCTILVYFELCSSIQLAIEREKQIKAGSRSKKIKLINSVNPEWKDLYRDLV
ncbi:MAG: GIY-YIG nuclease family protein [Candidatus Melainabacteria bacterium]|jgi:putative endonuclease|nr:GIY-YIG nuclease family protein [Candidatus Melainabacteria bacterium]